MLTKRINFTCSTVLAAAAWAFSAHGADAATAQKVQSGTVVNAANGIQSVAISGVDPAKSFLIFETRSNSNRPVGSEVRGRIPIACANPCTTIEFERVTDGVAPEPAAINIQWYVVSFVSGVTVQRGETLQDASAKNVTISALSAVNRAFVIWSKTPFASDGTWDGNDPVLGEITSTTNLQFRSDATGAYTISWQIIEFTNPGDVNVQKGSIFTMDAATTSVTATLSPAVDVNHTFVLAGFKTAASGAANIGAMLLRAQLTDSTTITIDRSTFGSPAVAISEIAWQAIELNDGTMVSNGTSNFAAAAATATVPMMSYIDVTRAIAFGSVQSGGGQNEGRSAYVGDDIIGVATATTALSATQLTLTRGNTAAAADIGWSVVEFAQSDAQVLSGSYVGNAAAGRQINVGFVPDFVIVKGDTTQIGAFRSSTMVGDAAKPASGATALQANLIQSIDMANGGGFTVGSNVSVNASAVTYHWIAFKAGPGKMSVGTYSGDGAAGGKQITGVGLAPDLVFIMSAGGAAAIHRSSAHVNTHDFEFSFGDATLVTSLDADGFTVGTNDARINAASTTYHYVVWHQVAGEMKVGMYTGNAAAQNITGVGFEAELVMIKAATTGQDAIAKPASTGRTTDASMFYRNLANGTGRVTALQSDGFSIGATGNVSQSGQVFVYYAWKRAAQPIVLSGNYQGNGIAGGQVVNQLGFQPDVVIVKTVAQIAYIRTSSMTAGNSKALTGATALQASRISSLDASGFTLGGNNATVNANAAQYYFTAFKASPSTMKVGTYTGQGATPTSITGLGFSPELVFILPRAAAAPMHFSSQSTEAYTFSADAGTTGLVALNSDGFTVSTTNASVNASAAVYDYIAWNEIPGEMEVGGYTAIASPADNTNITGVGFQPEYLVVKQIDARDTVARPASLVGDANLFFSAFATNPPNEIQALQADGFQIGTDVQVNEASKTYVYYAWRRPFISTLAVTAVRLTQIDATRYDRGVLIQWKTGHEVDNLGFHIDREINGQRTRVTPSLIAGSGLMAGHGTEVNGELRYAFWDLGAAATDRSAVYWLEDVDFNGKVTAHGPVIPVDGVLQTPPAVASSVALRDVNKESRRRGKSFRTEGTRLEPRWTAKRSPDASNQLDVQWSLAAQKAVKIGVTHAGWYRVTQPELVAAGLDPRVNPRTLRLYAEGIERAIVVTGEGDGRFDSSDAIEFYGTGLDTPFTDTRVYWLVGGGLPARRITVRESAGRGSDRSNQNVRSDGASFWYTVQQKDRSIFFAALKNGEAENWFGQVVSPEPADISVAVTHLDRAAASPVQLEITLQGVTVDGALPSDHRVGVMVNDAEVGELVFSGQTLATERFAVRVAALVDGANVVRLVARGGEADYSLVDTVRLSYWHTYDADADVVAAAADAPRPITIGGFASRAVRLVDITDPTMVEEIRGTVGTDRNGFASISAQLTGSDARTLFAFTDATIASPAYVRANRPSSWHDTASSYDYLSVTHALFANSAETLAATRRHQGLTAATIDVEDIYDEFNFGEKAPQALKDFVQRAHTTGKRAPRFLVLVGDATLDPRDYSGFGDADFVPTAQVPMAQVVLETASDDWFADADDDGVPELAVGRLSARTSAQAQQIVSKIIGYETSTDASWIKNVLVVADENDETSNFEQSSRALRPFVPADYTVRQVFRGTLGPDEARLELLDAVNQGQLIVNYTGHGSMRVWGHDASLLTAADIRDSWRNRGRLPLVVAMNCLNGFFHDIYDEESLGETFQRAPDGGAVAAWASSALTQPGPQAQVNQELFRLLFSQPELTIGEAIAAAKRVVADRDVRRSWILFGDPAMRLRGMARVAPRDTRSSPAFDALATATLSTNVSAASNQQADVLTEQDVHLADFTGDRRDDMRLYTPETGWQVFAARLNEDALADLFFYHRQTGEWITGINAKANAGQFTYRSGKWTPELQILLSDLNADGRDEVVGYDPRTGIAVLATADSSGALLERRVTWPASTRLHVGDLNGDGLEDLIGYDTRTGRGFVALNGKRDFTITETQWGAGWQATVADLNDDWRSDLVFYDPATGTARLALSEPRGGFAFQNRFWAPGMTLHAADFTGDTRQGLLGYSEETGAWFIGIWTAKGWTERAGLWAAGRRVAIGDLDGDGRDDVVNYDQLTGAGSSCLTVSPGVFTCRPEVWTPDRLFIGRPR